METIESDRNLAFSKEISFDVCKKIARGHPWITVKGDIKDLREAINIAYDYYTNERNIYEFGVFTSNGFIYWSSIDPDIFNVGIIRNISC
jgi:hypothetical protein